MMFTASDVSFLAESLSRWELGEYTSEALVIVACAGELVADFGRKCLTRAHRDRVERLSTILLVAALSASLICLVRTNELSGSVIGSLGVKAEDADRRAKTALTDSGTAQQEADAVAMQADALTLRMKGASRTLGQLEQDIVAQGPRWRLLKKAAPELTKQLAPFAGQRAELFICGRLGSQDGETLSTWGAIANILDSDVVSGAAGAKWKLVPTNLVFFDRGCSPGGGQPLGQGVVVMVSKRASQATMDAAKALGEGLLKALPPSPSNALSVIDPDFSQRFVQPIEGKETPWAMAANDPDLITVLIGAHPQ
jgi:hypothetical protein